MEGPGTGFRPKMDVRSRYRCHPTAVTPAEFVAAVSPGDTFLARSYDVELIELIEQRGKRGRVSSSP